MLVNKASIQAAFISLKTIYNNAFAAAPSSWAKIAMKVPSTTGQNDYAWLSNFPKMRLWIGAKHVKNLSASTYSVVNDDFEATVEVDRNHFDDDQLGIYEPQAKMAGFSAAQLPDEIVYGAVNKAFATLCHDGQYFFDTDHPVGERLVSNKSTAPLSVATKALAVAGYGAARSAMKQFKDDEGRSLNITPNVLLVGPAMEDTARALLTNAKFDDGSENIYRNTAELVVDGRIESDTAWYLLDTTKPIMPFVYQERKAPVFVQQINAEAEDVFNQRKYKFGAEARGAAGYGFWQLAFGSTGA